MGSLRARMAATWAASILAAATLLVCAGECKAKRPENLPGLSPNEVGAQGPEAGISPAEAAGLQGIWEVEHVGVNMADQPHWKWLPDDPQLVGREFIVSAEGIRFADFKEANCKPATWGRKTSAWKDLVDDLFLGPASKQTPARFRVKASGRDKVNVFEPCALTTPGRRGPGNNWVLGSWVVPVVADKLIMEFDADSVLYLSRRSGPPKASFDCGKAATPTEKAICGDASLAAWDRSIALAWKRLRERDGGVDSAVKAKHVEWLRTRNACGADVACLAATMREHTSYLVFAGR